MGFVDAGPHHGHELHQSLRMGRLQGPKSVVEPWSDLHIYLANSGTRRLTICLPKRLVYGSRMDRAPICRTNTLLVRTLTKN